MGGPNSLDSNQVKISYDELRARVAQTGTTSSSNVKFGGLSGSAFDELHQRVKEDNNNNNNNKLETALEKSAEPVSGVNLEHAPVAPAPTVNKPISEKAEVKKETPAEIPKKPPVSEEAEFKKEITNLNSTLNIVSNGDWRKPALKTEYLKDEDTQNSANKILKGESTAADEAKKYADAAAEASKTGDKKAVESNMTKKAYFNVINDAQTTKWEGTDNKLHDPSEKEQKTFLQKVFGDKKHFNPESIDRLAKNDNLITTEEIENGMGGIYNAVVGDPGDVSRNKLDFEIGKDYSGFSKDGEFKGELK